MSLPMVAESQARMYLSDRRLKLQNPFAQNFNLFLTEQGYPSGNFGALRSLTDDRLRGGISLLVQAEEAGTVVLIPYIGDVVLTVGTEGPRFLEEGRVQAFTVEPGDLYEIRNPYPDDAINFFQLRISGTTPQEVKVFPIVMEAYPNTLRPLYEGTHLLSIGQFDGRAESVYQLKNAANNIFVFVIEGAFEFQNRLLEPRDGLALWNVAEVEFEALSQGAVVLVVEI